MIIIDHKPKELDMDNYIVSFIDILGFKNLIRENKGPTIYNEYTEVIKRLRVFWKKTSLKAEFKTTLFSDSIIICVKYDKHDLERKRELYKSICIASAQLQVELLTQNIWIRGGISHGEMIFEESTDTIIYGDAFIKAYELEEKTAIYPRIVVDPNVLDFLGFPTLKETFDYFNGNDYTNWKGDILFDTIKFYNDSIKERYITLDTPIFLDFAESIINMSQLTDINCPTGSELSVSLRKKLITSNSKIYKKYNWSRNYLTQKCYQKIVHSNGESIVEINRFRNSLKTM